MSLNILYHHRTQGRGAEGLHIASIVEALREMGHRVTVVSPPGVDPLSPQSSIPVGHGPARAPGGMQRLWSWVSRRLPNWLFELAEIAYNVPAWFRLRRALNAQRFDLVYERYAFYLLAGAFLCRRRGIPFVLEANEVSGIENRVRPQSFPALCRAFEKRLFARCASIQTVSSNLKRRIVAAGVPESRVQVSPNAFDAARVQGRTRSAELAARLGLQGRRTIGFAGWFSGWDRLDLLVEVFAQIHRDHPQACLLLIGDGAVAPELKQQVRSLGLEEHVVFTGAVPRAQVYDYIAQLDIAVLPHSNDFGSPVVMFEFMGLKIPVVAPRLDPVLDVQRDGETALLFDPLDTGQCRLAIDRLLRSESLREQLAERAHAMLVREFTWRRNAQRILDSVGLGAPVAEQAGAVAAVAGPSCANP